ncbi:MAG: hypothetical protein KJN72_07125 [Woeseia sp.]|nr:hypothetical protein [Woeseia sp.]
MKTIASKRRLIMCKFIIQIISLVLVIGFAGNVAAVSESECNDAINDIDSRIESGKYSDQNVSMAKLMRDSIRQACGFIDAAALEKMMEGFEKVLPTRTEAENQAYEEAKRKEREAQREKQRAELEAKRAEGASQQVETKKTPVSDVLKKPPTATTAIAKFIDRNDDMRNVLILDWDLYKNALRVLYVSYPVQNQEGLPTAKSYYYVLICDADGKITQHHVTDMPLPRLETAGLRPGHDEVIFQWPIAAGKPESRMSRWSISDGESLSSIVVPKLPWSLQRWSNADHFRLTTTDGNLLFAGNSLQTRGEKIPLEWLKMSPDGNILGQGTLARDGEEVRANSWFRTRNGGAGFVIDLLGSNDQQIQTDIDNLLIEIVEGVNLEGYVFTERRLLITDSDATVSWESTALERRFLWKGQAELAEIDMSTREKASMLMMDATFQHGEYHNVVDYSAGAIGNGYGVLLNVLAQLPSQPQMHGSWLYEYYANGQVRKTYLKAAAEFLKASFVMIAAPDANSVYLYARTSKDTPYLIALDKDRQVSAYAKVSMNSKTTPSGILADDGGVWVFGVNAHSTRKKSVWLERIDFK